MHSGFTPTLTLPHRRGRALEGNFKYLWLAFKNNVVTVITGGIGYMVDNETLALFLS
jgi:hypothetical protein